MHYFGHDFSFKKIFRKKMAKAAHSVAMPPPHPAGTINPISSSLSPAFGLALQADKDHGLWHLDDAPYGTTKRPDRRDAYRIGAPLSAQFEWHGISDACTDGVLTNLSGGGVQALVPKLPAASRLELSLKIPQAFVTTWLRQRPVLDSGAYELWEEQRQKTYELFEHISGQIVYAGPTVAQDQSLFQISVAFDHAQESCYRLVRYLERRTIQRVRQPQSRAVAAAA